MSRGGSAGDNRWLFAVLGILGVMILGLTVLIVLNVRSGMNNPKGENDALIDTSEEMAGWEGEISDSTRAAILSKQVQDLAPEQAMERYEKVLDAATGDLKVYVGLEYANYIYEKFDDSLRAVDIIMGVENVSENMATKFDLYTTLRVLYDKLGNSEKVAYCDEKIGELIPNPGTPVCPGGACDGQK